MDIVLALGDLAGNAGEAQPYVIQLGAEVTRSPVGIKWALNAGLIDLGSKALVLHLLMRWQILPDGICHLTWSQRSCCRIYVIER